MYTEIADIIRDELNVKILRLYLGTSRSGDREMWLYRDDSGWYLMFGGERKEIVKKERKELIVNMAMENYLKSKGK